MRERHKWRIKTSRVGNLGYQTAIGQGGLLAVTERTGAGTVIKHSLQGSKPQRDPVPVPIGPGRHVHFQLVLQVLQHAQIVEWMNLAGDGLSQRAYSGASGCIGR